MCSSTSFVMLLVEDHEGDQKLIGSALAAQRIEIDLRVTSCAEDALRYLLRSSSGDENSPWPDLILLDLNMPGMGGKEFLMHVKAHSDLCGIPIVVLTTSDSELDISECYEMHAAGYIQKPTCLDELKDVMENVITYWRASCLLARDSSPVDIVGTAQTGPPVE